MIQFRTILIFLLFHAHIVSGQAISPFFVDVGLSDRDQVFDQCADLFIGSKFFIQSLDRESGFFQCKHVLEGKGLFSSKDGDKIIYNILLRPNDAQGTRIYLQANVQERRWSGNTQTSVRYYDDKGVSDKKREYDPLLEFLIQHFNKAGD